MTLELEKRERKKEMTSYTRDHNYMGTNQGRSQHQAGGPGLSTTYGSRARGDP